ncbi:26074_t:CDS:1, partial [Racocetra persica]
TEILSTSTYPTISDVRLTIIGLLRHLESFLETHPDTNLDECMVANSINFKLQEYWEYVDEPTTIGALLDPRSKTKTFKDINKRDRAIALLRNKMELYKNSTQSTNTNLRPRESKRSFFESLISDQNSEQVT